MVAFCLIIMLLFVALAIDLGFAYVTQANLSKAVDAAALRGMLNIAQGTTAAGNVAKSVFAANYQSSGRDTAMPVPTVTFTTNPTTGLQQINVSATTTINTFFARIFPSWRTLTVSDTAQSTRADVMMTLVLDRSGSMNSNGGAQALPPAVNTFISYFSNTLDQAAVTTFSSTATLDQAMEHNFTSDVTNVVNGLVGNFGGGTYSQGGLDWAANQLCGWAVPGAWPYAGACPAVPNTTKVVVFFTDGWANTNYDVLNRQPGGNGCPSTPVYYGGCAWPEAQVGWCGGWTQPPYIGVWDSNQNNVNGCAPSTFPAHMPGNPAALDSAQDSETNVPNDAMYRAMTWANAMRAQGVIVYAIGLGDKISQPFLQQMANDPSGTSFEGFSINSNTPQGLAVFAVDCPGTGSSCSSELNQAFQTVATDILLRLTQ
jgi:Flp pilus assembly protein TadG